MARLTRDGLTSGGRSLQNHSGFLKFQARVTGVNLALVSIAEVAEEVNFPLTIGKKFCIEFVRVEPGHRPAIQPQSTRGKDEVRGLQRTIAEGGLVNQGFVPDEVGARVSFWN